MKDDVRTRLKNTSANYRPQQVLPQLQSSDEVDTVLTNNRENMKSLGRKIMACLSAIENKMSPSDQWMDSRQMCEFLKVTPNQLYVIRRKFNMPCKKPFGRDLYFDKEEIRVWLDNL